MTIKYSEGIKRPGTQTEYTPEMILELNKCSEDIWNFLPYIKIIHPDRGIIKFEPYDFQKQILKNFQNNRFNVVLASRQSGKCFFFDGKVKLRSKKTGDIIEKSVGDLFLENKK
jgi:hypothetical protein